MERFKSLEESQKWNFDKIVTKLQWGKKERHTERDHCSDKKLPETTNCGNASLGLLVMQTVFSFFVPLIFFKKLNFIN